MPLLTFTKEQLEQATKRFVIDPDDYVCEVVQVWEKPGTKDPSTLNLWARYKVLFNSKKDGTFTGHEFDFCMPPSFPSKGMMFLLGEGIEKPEPGKQYDPGAAKGHKHIVTLSKVRNDKGKDQNDVEAIRPYKG